MNIILFDHEKIRTNLYPFTLTRSAADIRIGILTIAGKWEKLIKQEDQLNYITAGYIQPKYPLKTDQQNFIVASNILPDKQLISQIQNLQTNETLINSSGNKIATCLSEKDCKKLQETLEWPKGLKEIPLHQNCLQIDHPWHIFQHNGEAIKSDFSLICSNRTSEAIQDPFTRIYNTENVFVEEGASLKACIINAEKGPVYIGKNASVQEGAIIQGPFAMGEKSQVTMGAKIRADTTLGPFCKAGGEVNNAVMFGYSNKAHEGFLGNSVIGEWCNMGADTNVSNLKNNYDYIKLWDEATQDYVKTDVLFCGLFMGDHSKCGINTMFNTGTTVGVSANIFNGGFPQKHVPSFSWGGEHGLSTYKLEKAIETANNMMKRRDLALSEAEISILQHLYNQSQKQN